MEWRIVLRRLGCTLALLAVIGCQGRRQQTGVSPQGHVAPKQPSETAGNPEPRPRLPVRELEDFELRGSVATAEHRIWTVGLKDGREVQAERPAADRKMTFDRQGRLLLYQYWSDGVWMPAERYVYREDGLLVGSGQSGTDDLESRYDYAWESGALTVTARSGETGDVLWLELQLFDDDGNVMEVRRSRGKDLGNLESKHEYIYDEAGRITRDTVYARQRSGLAPSQTIEYRYDALGRLVEMIETLDDGTEVRRSQYRYDGSAKLPAAEDYYDRSSISAHTLFSYAVDPAGNWVQRRRSVAPAGSSEYHVTRMEDRTLTYHTQ